MNKVVGWVDSWTGTLHKPLDTTGNVLQLARGNSAKKKILTKLKRTLPKYLWKRGRFVVKPVYK